jgi:metal-responsive CopG/Arc/MetJ family transcriptional regulator
MAKSRLQFDFSEEAIEELDQLQEKTGLATRAELIRQALRILQWMMHEATENEATFLLEKDGKQREIVFPFWSLKGRKEAVASKEVVAPKG